MQIMRLNYPKHEKCYEEVSAERMREIVSQEVL